MMTIIAASLVATSSSTKANTASTGASSIYGDGGNLLSTLPESFAIGDQVFADLPPGVLAYTTFAIQRDSLVAFNVSLLSTGRIVIYYR